MHILYTALIWIAKNFASVLLEGICATLKLCIKALSKAKIQSRISI